jgi:hypothetical protein
MFAGKKSVVLKDTKKNILTLNSRTKMKITEDVQIK